MFEYKKGPYRAFLVYSDPLTNEQLQLVLLLQYRPLIHQQ
jgi:hypothetical protein